MRLRRRTIPAQLPYVVQAAFAALQAPVVFGTVDAQGTFNAAYGMPCKVVERDKVVLCDTYFAKTRANLLSGSHGAVLYLTSDMKPYQVKGALEYLTTGSLFVEVRDSIDPKHPRVAAIILPVKEVYSGAEKLV